MSKSIRIDGIAYISMTGKDFLIIEDGTYSKKLRLVLSVREIGYLAEQLHQMLKLNQDDINQAKTRLRGEP